MLEMAKKSDVLELVQKAQMLERDIMPSNKGLTLIKYDKDGSIVRELEYDYTPANVARINSKLEKAAKKRRRKWEAKYLEFAHFLPEVGWVMIPEDYGVNIIEAEGQGTEDEVQIAFLGYNEIEIQHLATMIADALLENFDNNAPKMVKDDLEREPEEISIDEAIDDFANRFSMTGEELQELARSKGLIITAEQ